MFKDIDDAINVMKRKYDRIEKLNVSTGEYHSEYDKQVIDWLEELKELRAKISELYDERQAENAFMKEHDKEVIMDTIDECIKDLEGSYPLIDNRDLQHGFCCAIQRLEQIKEEKGDNNE